MARRYEVDAQSAFRLVAGRTPTVQSVWNFSERFVYSFENFQHGWSFVAHGDGNARELCNVDIVCLQQGTWESGAEHR